MGLRKVNRQTTTSLKPASCETEPPYHFGESWINAQVVPYRRNLQIHKVSLLILKSFFKPLESFITFSELGVNPCELKGGNVFSLFHVLHGEFQGLRPIALWTTGSQCIGKHLLPLSNLLWLHSL